MKVILVWLLLLLSVESIAKTKPLIPVYSYHLKPPLVIDIEKQEGLYFDFVRYLNERSEKYRFTLVSIPRKRIERMLEDKTFDGVLLGVNPTWFKDKQETQYLWTAKVFTDRDEIVSLRSSPYEFANAESLKGRVVGGVRGFYYFGINEMVAKDLILRVDTTKETDLFNMLLLKRVDVAVISRSTFDYLIKINQWHDKFHLSKKPHDIFDRRILVPKAEKSTYKELTHIVNQLQFDKSWQYRLLEYK